MKLASIFTDHAVLQRNMYLPVWGTTARPGAIVHAELAGSKATVMSSADCEFLLRLPPLDAGGPYTLRVWTDGEEVVRKDIMIGEVWLASGQSNMDYLLSSDWSVEKELPEKDRTRTVNLEQAREFQVRDASRVRGIFIPRCASGCNEKSVPSEWKCMTKEEAQSMTAVGMWFAKFLEENLDVTIGIIGCAWGGTGVEAWTSRSGLMSDPKSRFWMEYNDAVFYREENWKNDPLSSYEKADPGNKGFDWGWAAPGFDDSDWKIMHVPGSWIQQKLAGNGAFWVRCRVDIPEEWVGQELTLHLGGIDKTDITYFNEVEVGRTGQGSDTKYWNRPRIYKIPADQVKAGQAVIAIRAYSFLFDGSLNSHRKSYYLELGETGKSILLPEEWRGNAEVDFGDLPRPPWMASECSFGCAVKPGPNKSNTPGILFHGMIRPLIPFGIRGVIWYQGEHNAKWASEYRRSLALMIRDWRYHWAQGDFPFIQVQLAKYLGDGKPGPFDEGSAWALLREAQEGVCRDLPETYLVTALDIGETNDIHPQNKKDVGRRLAQSALYHVYRDSSVTPCGPVFEKSRVEGHRLRVMFRYGEGLHFQGGEPKGFFLAGRDGVFHPADEVRIDGDSLLLSSPEVEIPLAARYCWANDPDGNLRNKADLPAFPFRTEGSRF